MLMTVTYQSTGECAAFSPFDSGLPDIEVLAKSADGINVARIAQRGARLCVVAVYEDKTHVLEGIVSTM